MTVAYQAYAGGGFCVTGETPKAAASKFFEKFPSKRKCSIIEGQSDGISFIVQFGPVSKGQWPRSWKDVTRGSVAGLPDSAG